MLQPLKTAFYQLWVPMGRSSRQTFWTWFAVLVAVLALFRWGLTFHDPSGAVFFWGFFFWMIALVQGVFGVFGKRLKDMGRPIGWVILLITLTLAAILFFALIFGAGDYLAEYSQYERKVAIDETVKTDIDAAYVERLSAAPTWIMTLTISALWAGFIAWIGLSPSQDGPNHYGLHTGWSAPPPKT